MLSDPVFWVAVALVIFLAIAWRVGAPGMITKALDARGEKVTRELSEAKLLREEAERLLADFKRKQKEAQAEAEQIVAGAKAEAEQLRADSIAKVNEFVARRTKMAEQKIALAEAQAIADVRATAADVAVEAARSILTNSLAGGGAADVTARAVSEATAKLN